MRLLQPDPRQRRVIAALFLITTVLAVLLTAFYHTQVVAGDRYAAEAEGNRLRPVEIPAPRGTVYDRYGKVVATSVPGFSVTLLPGKAETIEATLRDLQPFLGLSDAQIASLLKQRAGRPNDLVEVTDNATFSQVAALEERRTSFPNLLMVDRPKRYYPAGAALGHMIGYVAEISPKELQQERYQEAGYRQGRWIGKAGMEKQYELLLSGRDGARFVEVDAMGRIVNPRSTVGVKAPTPGKNLRLTLDLELQKYVREIFPDTMKGAVVAMVPSTGEVLALYSNPSYDPNGFVGGIPGSLWKALSNDPDKPLLDRAIYALYPPASTWKLATAAAGVKRGFLKADTRMPIPCTGGMTYAGRYFRCWYAPGHGSLDLAGAIEKSCNVYFYQVGIRLGLRGLIEAGTRMGFSTKTGIDLPGESSPVFPTGIDWYQRRFGWAPTPSEVMSLSIGQGPNSQTVIKMAHFYSAIAGNGTAPEPHLASGQAEEGELTVDLGVNAEGLRTLWAGLERVTEPGGTAVLSSLKHWKIYGKTGTAQNAGEDHGWFVGFSGRPGGNPEIVVAAIIEHGLHGSDVSPLAAKLINHYLSRKHGIPVDPQPTLIERWERQAQLWGTYDKYPAPLIPATR